MPAGNSKKILIVDDDMDMRFLLSSIVKKGGYDTIVTKNGREGFKTAMDVRPDLILLDVMMPQEGGAVIYRKLKKEKSLSSIPVIILSAVSRYTFYHYIEMVNSQTVEKIPKPDKYMEKPPSPDDLLCVIDDLLAENGNNAAET